MLTLLGTSLAARKAPANYPNNLSGTTIQNYAAADQLGGPIDSANPEWMEVTSEGTAAT